MNMEKSRSALMITWFVLGFFAIISSQSALAGFSTGVTRVIYNENSRSVTIPVNSDNGGTYYLVQGWVEKDDGSRADFMVTPPIMKLAPGSQNNFSVKYLGKPLPTDRESLFYLNVKAIPARDASIGNQLTITNKNILKLIYRPTGLSFKDATDAPKKITLVRENNKVVIKNPTPFYVNIGEFLIDEKLQNDVSYVAPFGQWVVNQPLKSAHAVIKYRTINDFGGASSYSVINL